MTKKYLRSIATTLSLIFVASIAICIFYHPAFKGGLQNMDVQFLYAAVTCIMAPFLVTGLFIRLKRINKASINEIESPSIYLRYSMQGIAPYLYGFAYIVLLIGGMGEILNDHIIQPVSINLWLIVHFLFLAVINTVLFMVFLTASELIGVIMVILNEY